MSETPLESERAKKVFLAHIRHELRTPINAIIGYSEMLLEDIERQGQDGLPSDLNKIHSAGKELLLIVNDILDPRRFEGEEDMDMEKLRDNIHHALRTPATTIIGLAEMLIEEAEGTDQKEFKSDVEKIHSAGNKLLTLIDEIVNFSAIQDRMVAFDLGDSSLSTQIQGIVATIPSLVKEDSHRPKVDQGSILIVDDNETNRDILSRRLGRQGYTTMVAEDGYKALEMLKTQGFDLVLLDLMMPGINGYEVLKQLKADSVLHKIPVIMLSAIDELDSVVRCIERGAEDYLTKPFDPVLLKTRINACLEKKRLREKEITHLREIKKEKELVDNLLHVIFPPQIVKELKTCNKVTPRRCENVAVLFCDIVGFTPYCERHEPEEVVQHLQEMIEVYEYLAYNTYGIEKIKTVGDSFMATAGLLESIDNPVLNCVRFGLEMVSKARELSWDWRVRVGIHVGPVIAGIVGSRRYLFDLWGDTVNTAARVESNGVADAVNVTMTVWERISDQCYGESIGLVQLKGKGEIEIFRVDGLKGQ